MKDKVFSFFLSDVFSLSLYSVKFGKLGKTRRKAQGSNAHFRIIKFNPFSYLGSIRQILASFFDDFVYQLTLCVKEGYIYIRRRCQSGIRRPDCYLTQGLLRWGTHSEDQCHTLKPSKTTNYEPTIDYTGQDCYRHPSDTGHVIPSKRGSERPMPPTHASAHSPPLLSVRDLISMDATEYILQARPTYSSPGCT